MTIRIDTNEFIFYMIFMNLLASYFKISCDLRIDINSSVYPDGITRKIMNEMGSYILSTVGVLRSVGKKGIFLGYRIIPLPIEFIAKV